MGYCRCAAWSSQREHFVSGLQERSPGSAIAGIAARHAWELRWRWDDVTETVTVTDRRISDQRATDRGAALQNRTMNLYSISPNVTNLQRRVAGILPIAIEVPRSGKAYRFVRPLVMEEETRITFQYKSR